MSTYISLFLKGFHFFHVELNYRDLYERRTKTRHKHKQPKRNACKL